MRGDFVYRLYPTTAQVSARQRTLRECRWLYNHLPEQRKAAWSGRGAPVGLYEQQQHITAVKRERTALATVDAQVLQNVALRLTLAMHAFFRRVKSGETPGFPRFRGEGRYDSFTCPQAPGGGKLTGDRLYLHGIGTVRVVLHRPMEGTSRIVTVRRSSTGKWYAIVSCEVADAPLPERPEQVGIDVGLAVFAAFSAGARIENPRFSRADEQALGRARRRMAKHAKGTPERRPRRKPVARIHERIAFRRHDFARQLARRIENGHGVIAVENLRLSQMGRHQFLAEGIHDAAWGQFFPCLSEKAASAARTFVAINPADTSQDCSGCGVRKAMSLAERVYSCASCGLVLDRDHNASLNILAVGRHGLGLAPRSSRL